MSFDGNNKGFIDTKQFRKCVLETANERLGIIINSLSNGKSGTFVPKDRGLLGLLDSSYKSDVPSTNYALHLKAIAFESARFLCSSKKVTDDIIFDHTRGEYLSQNIAEFLFPGQRFSQTNSTDERVRNFYLSIIEAYFGGSTRNNIEKSLLRFLDVPVGIVENFIISRYDSTLDSIINKFTFDINIQVDDPRVKDVTQLQADIEFLLNIIKPAHTAYTTKFIFSELFDIFRKGCLLLVDDDDIPIITHDGFETNLKLANTSICEVFHLDTHDYFYEDFRKKCFGENFIKIEDEVIQKQTLEGNIRQASPRWATSKIGGTWSYSDPYIFHTRFGPFGREDGSLAQSITDIQVYVNDIRVEVDEIYPLSSAFKLRNLPSEEDTITVSYYFLRKYIGALITNDLDSVLNNGSAQGAELSYQTVLFPTGYSLEQKFPLEKSYKYKGFNLFNSSVLNDALTLNMNELSLRNRLNDYSIFKSFGYDQNIYSTTLIDGQELVPRSLEKKDVWRRIPYQEFRLNNNEFIMNNLEDRMYGELHYESYHPFYSVLEYDILDNGGEPNLVQTICEDSKEGMILDFRRLFEEDFTVGNTQTTITTDRFCQFYTFPLVPEHYLDGVYKPATYTNLNNLDCVLQGGNSTWDLEHPIDDIPNYYLGGNHTTMRMMLHEINEENYDKVDELWEILWNRDPSENYLYSTSIIATGNDYIFVPGDATAYPPGTFKILDNNLQEIMIKEGRGVYPEKYPANSSDRGYLLHTFTDSLGYTNQSLDAISPIHLDDVSREYYKEESWFIIGSSLTNENFNVLHGTKLKESNIDESYVKLTEYIPLMMNSYTPNDIIPIDSSINSHGVKVASINNNPPHSSPLTFLTPRKILNNNVLTVYNETNSFYYNLTGMTILNNQVIDLDESINPNLENGDIVRVVYEATDYINDYDHLISVNDPDNFILFSPIEVSLVYEIFNHTKGFAYNLTGSSYLESNKLIHLDPHAGDNSFIGLDQNDIIFARYITINPEENPAPVLTQSNNNFILTSISIVPV